MAEGGGTSGENNVLYASVLYASSGSEFVFDFFCELCIDDGKYIEAEGFCVDCGEYLCGTCFNGHRLTRPTRHHVLLDKENMPKDTPLATDRIIKDISTKCQCKSGDVVKFYCKSHDIFGCSTCFATVHKSCVEIESILEKSETILDSQVYKEFVTMLKDLQTKSRDIISRSIENQALAKRCCMQTAHSVKKFKGELIEILNEIEQNIVKNAEKMMSEDIDSMEKIAKESTAMLEQIQGISADVDQLHASKRSCQLYIQLQEKNSEVTALRAALQESEKKNTVREYTFEPSGELRTYLYLQDIIGTCRQTDRKQVDAAKATVARVADIDISSKDDASKRYFVRGITILPNNRLVIVDGSHKNKVGIFDTNTMREICKLKLSSFACDVTMTAENQIAVTLHDSGKIVLVNVGETIDREIIVGEGCRGVAYNRNRLFVTFDRNPRLEILDLRGNVIRKMESDDGGNKLFTCPEYVRVSDDGTSMYVSDYNRHQVIRLSMEGKVKSIYEDSELKRPAGSCIDQDGNVYVCSREYRNVHMLTDDCKKIKVILTRDNGLGDDPMSVSYCRKTHRLFVGMSNKNVEVFRLSS